MGYADELRAMIKKLEERPRIVGKTDKDQVESNKETIALMHSALTAIGGSAYWQRVFHAAGMPDSVGNWETSPRETATAYNRVLSAMLTTQDMQKIINLAKIRVPIA